MSADTEVRTYGNWRRPESGGLYGLGRSGTYLLYGGSAVALLLIIFAGLIPAGVFSVVFAAVMGALLYKTPDGRNLINTGLAMLTWWKAKSNGETEYRSGPLRPMATYKLPGVLSTTTVTEWRDKLGRFFAMISYRTGHHTVAFETFPDGSTNMDKEDIDQQVAQLGGYISTLSMLGGVAQATLTIETKPDSGNHLQQILDSQTKENAPPLSKEVMKQIAATYPEGSATIRSFGTVTFSEKGRTGRKLNTAAARRESVAQSIAMDLPEITGQLALTGAGSSFPLDVQELCEVVFEAYNPLMGPVIERSHIIGDTVQTMHWDNVGPSYSNAEKTYYEHDSGYTVSLIMTLPPRQVVTSNVLSRLLEPVQGLASMRTTIIYRPLAVDKAASTAEKDHNNALFNYNSATRKTATLSKQVKTAEHTSLEQADGASLSDFAIVINATVLDEEDIPFAKDVIKKLSASAQLGTRPAYWYQPQAFALGLPVGLIPEHHIKTPGKRKRKKTA